MGLGGLRPAFEPARTVGPRFDPRLVADQPEQGKIGVELAIKHGFEVELKVRLAGEAHGIAQDAQPQAIGDEAPLPCVTAVEGFLEQAMRAGFGSAGDAGLAAVEIDAAADEVDGGLAPEMGDRVTLAIDLDRLGRLETAVA